MIQYEQHISTTFSSRDNLARAAGKWLEIDRSQTDKSIHRSTTGQREGHWRNKLPGAGDMNKFCLFRMLRIQNSASKPTARSQLSLKSENIFKQQNVKILF